MVLPSQTECDLCTLNSVACDVYLLTIDWFCLGRMAPPLFFSKAKAKRVNITDELKSSHSDK